MKTNTLKGERGLTCSSANPSSPTHQVTPAATPTLINSINHKSLYTRCHINYHNPT